VILVTGTKRSGTSMWMQILQAAGLPVLGQAFPGRWGDSIRDANPRGFYESRFRMGLYYRTNPDPRSGEFVHPDAVADQVCKVFVPGLLRTDFAFVGRVLATMRPWREYAASLQRLYDLEKANTPPRDELGERDSASEKRVRQGRLPAALEWWFENYELIRDVTTRRYPFHLLTYDRLLRDPAGEIGPVLDWLGHGELEPAVAAVDPGLRTFHATAHQDPRVDDEAAAVFDALYEAVDQGGDLSPDLVSEMNRIHLRLAKAWDEERATALEQRT